MDDLKNINVKFKYEDKTLLLFNVLLKVFKHFQYALCFVV